MRTIRLLPGQVVIRELRPTASTYGLWTPDPANPRDTVTHRGTVLAMGPPAEAFPGVPVPHGFKVGDEVIYHWTRWERGATREWPPDGLEASWIHQAEIDAVVDHA